MNQMKAKFLFLGVLFVSVSAHASPQVNAQGPASSAQCREVFSNQAESFKRQFTEREIGEILARVEAYDAEYIAELKNPKVIPAPRAFPGDVVQGRVVFKPLKANDFKKNPVGNLERIERSYLHEVIDLNNELGYASLRYTVLFHRVANVLGLRDRQPSRMILNIDDKDHVALTFHSLGQIRPLNEGELTGLTKKDPQIQSAIEILEGVTGVALTEKDFVMVNEYGKEKLTVRALPSGRITLGFGSLNQMSKILISQTNKRIGERLEQLLYVDSQNEALLSNREAKIYALRLNGVGHRSVIMKYLSN